MQTMTKEPRITSKEIENECQGQVNSASARKSFTDETELELFSNVSHQFSVHRPKNEM